MKIPQVPETECHSLPSSAETLFKFTAIRQNLLHRSAENLQTICAQSQSPQLIGRMEGRCSLRRYYMHPHHTSCTPPVHQGKRPECCLALVIIGHFPIPEAIFQFHCNANAFLPWGTASVQVVPCHTTSPSLTILLKLLLECLRICLFVSRKQHWAFIPVAEQRTNHRSVFSRGPPILDQTKVTHFGSTVTAQKQTISSQFSVLKAENVEKISPKRKGKRVNEHFLCAKTRWKFNPRKIEENARMYE